MIRTIVMRSRRSERKIRLQRTGEGQMKSKNLTTTTMMMMMMMTTTTMIMIVMVK